MQEVRSLPLESEGLNTDVVSHLLRQLFHPSTHGRSLRRSGRVSAESLATTVIGRPIVRIVDDQRTSFHQYNAMFCINCSEKVCNLRLSIPGSCPYSHWYGASQAAPQRLGHLPVAVRDYYYMISTVVLPRVSQPQSLQRRTTSPHRCNVYQSLSRAEITLRSCPERIREASRDQLAPPSNHRQPHELRFR